MINWAVKIAVLLIIICIYPYFKMGILEILCDLGIFDFVDNETEETDETKNNCND